MEYQKRISVLESMIQEKHRELQANDEQIHEKNRQLNAIQQALQHTIARRGEAEQLVSEFHKSLQQKDKTIADLQQILSKDEGKNQQQKEQQDTLSRTDLQPQQPLAIRQATVQAAQKNICRMRLRKGKNALEMMDSLGGAAALYGNTAYFTNGY